MLCYARHDELQFLIFHYAGEVRYTALSWMEKNFGRLQPDLALLMAVSDAPLLADLFTEDLEGAKGKAEGGKKEARRPTVGSTFRASLRALSATLLQTSARYIRCVKPNAEKRAGLFDGQFITRQLGYTGVMAVVEIQRSGYPISLPTSDFA